jgi:hypothetical protein
MQLSCPGLLLVTRAGFTVMIQRQRNNLANGEVQISEEQSMLIIIIKGIVHKEFGLEGQTVNSAYYCDVLQRQLENM